MKFQSMLNPEGSMRNLFVLLLAGLLSLASLNAEEGKWTPQQVLELDAAWLRQQGLQLPVSKLWDAQRGTGLLAATVNLGGCSAGFISPSGLILTNHHCLFGVLQEHSRPDRDLITQGFLARTPAEELPSKTTRVTVPRRFTDVTKELLQATAAAGSDRERYQAIENKQKQMVAECEKKPAARCRVAAFDGGVSYVLIETMELRDVRLVYAPPRSIGEFGGEIDNWMWPRHTGDFAIARAYVGPDGMPAGTASQNVPYQPEFYFPLSAQGVKPGDFVMVLGYPGTTVRSLTSAEMADRRDNLYHRRVDLYGRWIQILEEKSKGDPAAEIAVAATLKSLNNSFKNAQGQLDGLRRGKIIEKQARHEEVVQQWAAARPQWKEALAAKQELDQLVKEKRATAARDFLFASISSGPLALRQATQLARAALEREKPDAERDPAYMERELPRWRDRLEREQKSYSPAADQAMLIDWVQRAGRLESQERIAACDRFFGNTGEPAAIATAVARLYSGTRVINPLERARMTQENPAQLKARSDTLLNLAFDLDLELQAMNEVSKQRDGAVARLRPAWRKAVLAQAGKPVAPDANSTLRVSFAHVQGYSPRDAVTYGPQTTLNGVLEKVTGVEPFQLPEKVRAAAHAGRLGAWRDAGLQDVPVCFLADADTTGGNSGSPTVNGRGELVGINFDRVWENVANDFGFNPQIARNINVDVRYLLWMLDQVENADELLRELKVRR